MTFGEAAALEFSFLVSELGFECNERGQTLARFEKEGVLVNIYHGRSSFEVSFEVVIADRPGAAVVTASPADVAALGDLEGNYFFQSSNPDVVLVLLHQLATLLSDHGRGLLRPDMLLVERVRWVQSKRSQEQMKKWELEDARRDAEVAWKEHRWGDLIRALSPVEAHLLESERKKLSYARRQVQR